MEAVSPGLVWRSLLVFFVNPCALDRPMIPSVGGTGLGEYVLGLLMAVADEQGPCGGGLFGSDYCIGLIGHAGVWWPRRAIGGMDGGHHSRSPSLRGFGRVVGVYVSRALWAGRAPDPEIDAGVSPRRVFSLLLVARSISIPMGGWPM